ncbi:MAG: cysteine desulfurase, SufS subfamily [Anaerocolumna sp.]|jgi:cysteine desulfurase/selenocysteine lyase|nr:cysteine desulfurase, SufS subfamily [Anaerocolumna sp.]
MSNPYKDDFPILSSYNRDKPLIYFDNAATTQKPATVIAAVSKYYEEYNANPYRGLYEISEKATAGYEKARTYMSHFIHSQKSHEIIFTRNTTESINLIAFTYGKMVLKEQDEVVISIAEHHSNLLPWQQITKEKNATLSYLYLDTYGHIPDEEIENKITSRTKIVSLGYVSNVLGTVNPVEKIIEKAHSVGAIVILDCAQSIPHFPLDVTKLDVDFAVFSGHKILGPMGIGVLYGKEVLLNQMPPFLTGGEMIEYVTEQEATFAPLPQKFEAGTPNVGGAIGLMEGIKYIEKVGYETIKIIEEELTDYALTKMQEIPEIIIYGEQNGRNNRCGVISFNVDGVHPHDTSSILDSDGIAVRAGHHCAQPLMKYMKVNATCRISLYFYNTKDEIDIFINSLKKVRRLLGLGN